MPGQLRSDAHCPVCGNPLLGLTDETRASGCITREYFHARAGNARRPPCVRSFSDVHKAGAERRGLEVDRAVVA